jgi:hypothetical protein
MVKGGRPMVCARNARAWAIGVSAASGFLVRRVVWGQVLAREERREGEEVRPALIMVRGHLKRRWERKHGQGDA